MFNGYAPMMKRKRRRLFLLSSHDQAGLGRLSQSLAAYLDKIGHWHADGKTITLEAVKGLPEQRLTVEENGTLSDGLTDGVSFSKTSRSAFIKSQ